MIQTYTMQSLKIYVDIFKSLWYNTKGYEPIA